MEEQLTAVPATTPEPATPEPVPEAEEPATMPEEPADGIDVRFNHKTTRLSREEAVEYAQQGMKFRELQPLWDDLRALASGRGVTPAQLVDSLKREQESTEPPPRETLGVRLAEEFEHLREQMPEVTAFRELPREVVETAVAEGIPLMDAYLRHRFFQERRLARAAEDARAAQTAAVGSVADPAPRDLPDPVLTALQAGLRRALS